MKFTQIPAPDFDLAMTLDSGQVFHWQKAEGGFIGTIGDRAAYVEQRGDVLKVRGGDVKLDGFKPSNFARIFSNYFALDHPLAESL